MMQEIDPGIKFLLRAMKPPKQQQQQQQPQQQTLLDRVSMPAKKEAPTCTSNIYLLKILGSKISTSTEESVRLEALQGAFCSELRPL